MPNCNNTALWDKDLIAKYNYSGPRYTSYPTALQFSTEYTAKEYQQLCKKNTNNIAPLSLYVHIPFCENICYYCACNKIVTRDKSVSRNYLNVLKKEIELQSKLFPEQRHITQLHFGGGTPTFLNPAEMTELWHSLASHFTFTDDDKREYAIEIDPRTIDNNYIALLKGLGINRISLGIQDFDPLVQTSINRIQSFESVQALMKELRRHNFKSISFDLIYGLPHQSLHSFAQTLEKVIELSPDRIACYNYAHLPKRFSSQRAIDRHTLPSAKEKLDMLDFINQTLCKNEYQYIGMDHFVKATDELAVAQQKKQLQRNFQGYSSCLAPDIIGLGISSIGQVYGAFVQNHKKLDDYYKAINNGHLAIERGLQTSRDDRLRQQIISNLICHFELDIHAFERQHNVNFMNYFSSSMDKLNTFQQDGLLSFSADKLLISAKGRPLIRIICMAFDAYQIQTGAATQYSKVI